MSTSRPFAYNTGAPISGTEQLGSLAIGIDPIAYNQGIGGVRWWNGPDEDLGYVIAQPVTGGNQPNPDFVDAYVGFFRTNGFTEVGFINLAERISNYTQNFSSGGEAKTWLNSNGYWTSYVPGPITTNLIVNWDIQNNNSYNGSGSTITDLQSNSNGTLVGTIDYTSGSPASGIPNYLLIQGGATEYIRNQTGLNAFLSPVNSGTSISYFVWVYPTGNGVIVTELGQSTPNTGWHDSQIEIVSGALKFRLWNLAAPYLTSSTSLTLNTWNYIGLTYNGTTFRCYLNGSEVASTNMTRLTPFNNGGGLNLYYALGANDFTSLGDGNGATFRFGAFQVYNTGLSGADVLTNFNNTKSSYI